MQNFLRRQHTNVRSFNLVSVIASNLNEYLSKLHYPIAFDEFIECVLALTEFVQGPNVENQSILVDNEFVEIAH